jgi:hypothetical protein
MYITVYFSFLSIISNENLLYGVSNDTNKHIVKDMNCQAPEMPFATNTE